MSDSHTPPRFWDAVVGGFRRFDDYSGRDTRAQFWPYAGVVLGGVFVTSNVTTVAIFAAGLSQGAGDTDRAVIWAGLGVTAVMVLVVFSLLAAAVTRRLHDRDRRGAWACVPLALVASGLVIFGLMSSTDDEPSAALFLLGFANNLLYFVALIALVAQLVMRGTPDDNRFGPGNGRR